MGVSGPGGSNSCQTQVYYNNYVPQQSVSLSQIPYTGFDFGPAGNTIYWLSLLMFAVAGAYLLVYYRGGAFSFATSMLGNRAPKVTAAIEAPAKAVGEVIAPIAKRIEDVIQARTHSNVVNADVTTDTMTIAHGHEGQSPRIVINRR